MTTLLRQFWRNDDDIIMFTYGRVVMIPIKHYVGISFQHNKYAFILLYVNHAFFFKQIQPEMGLSRVKYVYTTSRSSPCSVNLELGVNYILLGKDSHTQWLTIISTLVVINMKDGTTVNAAKHDVTCQKRVWIEKVNL